MQSHNCGRGGEGSGDAMLPDCHVSIPVDMGFFGFIHFCNLNWVGLYGLWVVQFNNNNNNNDNPIPK